MQRLASCLHAPGADTAVRQAIMHSCRRRIVTSLSKGRVTNASVHGRCVQRFASSSRAEMLSGLAMGKRRFVVVVGAVAAGTAAYFVGTLIAHRYDGPPLANVAAAAVVSNNKKKLVILGSGWGAVSLLKNIDAEQYDIAVVSPQNYFLFTPLLPSVTVGTVEARSIVEPIRRLLGKKKREKLKFYEAECSEVNLSEKKLVCKDTSAIVGAQDTFVLDYDFLIVAVGAKTNTYNIKGVKEHAHYLKEIYDAQKIRKNVMDSFETAALPNQPDDEVNRLLHFVVVGGGPTGVEFAAELRDFISQDLSKLYPSLHEKVKITLVDGYNKILNTYDDEISRYTEERFRAEKIDVIKSTFVVGIDEGHVTIMDAGSKVKSTLPYGMCVWAAGLAPQDLTQKLIAKIPQQSNRNALQTNGYLQVKNANGVFALGDCSTVEVDLMVTELEGMFKRADLNNNGALSPKEFKVIMLEAQKRFPQATLYFSKAMNLEKGQFAQSLFDKADKDQSNSLTMDEFRTVLQTVDKCTTMLPATAQVAAQQGKYLGKMFSANTALFNQSAADGANVDLHANSLLPFDYHYLGSFAYVGDNRAVLKLPVVGSFKGLATMWLWRAAYTSECMSVRMKMLVLFDWTKSAVFGRDTSRI